jgi:hypothetical protein
MPVVLRISCALLGCALLLVGCRDSDPACAVGTPSAHPAEIPAGQSSTNVVVSVYDPISRSDFEVTTETTAESGVVAEPFALETKYTCAHDVSGPVEICTTTTYVDRNGRPDGASEVPNVAATQQKLGRPHVRIPDPLECSETSCTTVTCPEDKNICPVVSSLTADPMIIPEGETASIEVVANDPDELPQPLVTTTSATYGTIADPNASRTTYRCDPDVGGMIQICVVASDGDSSCDARQCIAVRCPGEPLENTCPFIESFTADPMLIPPGESETWVVVDATDQDGDELFSRLSSETGVFEDHTAMETIFRCGASGPVQLTVDVSDGDPECLQTQNIVVQCPGEIAANLCPMLFVINAIPTVIASGNTSTIIQTRGQDTDGLPIPLVLTLDALWGSFEDTENVPAATNVVEQNATYICDRPGFVELCVDATDGACTKTLCKDVVCPDTVPVP